VRFFGTVAVGKERAIGLGLVLVGLVSAVPTVWWLSVAATMRGPHTEPNLSDTLGYIALSSPFLIIPAVVIVRASLGSLLQNATQAGADLHSMCGCGCSLD
jgi:hypothetical protein